MVRVRRNAEIVLISFATSLKSGKYFITENADIF